VATLYIKEQGTRLHKRQERLVVTQGENQVMDVPVIKVSRVVVMGRGVQVSTAALIFLAQRGVPVIYTNRSGMYRASVTAGPSNNGALRLAQARVIDDPARALPLVKAVVRGKLHNQAVLLQTLARLWGDAGQRAVAVIERLRREVDRGETADQVRGFEGAGAAAYWHAWSSQLKASWAFDGRKYYPPPDPINALLSFGYTLLLHEALAAVQAVGLDPFLGFFHTVEYGRPSLALDVIEEFRPMLIDVLVLMALEQRLVTRGDFMQPPERPGAVYLDEAGRTRFLLAYEERIEQRVLYPFTNTQETWRRCVFLQVQQYARTIAGEQAEYHPMPWPQPRS
jgi:CRISPR-associated protein Cas1